MPGCSETSYTVRIERHNRARQRVRSKYPDLLEGSNGWNRALSRQLRKFR